MKKLFTLTLLLLAITALTQTPQGFNYQAVIRNSSGELIQNQDVSVRISILQGSTTGSSVYTETHSTQTNTYGLINLVIGQGASSDNFTTVDWSNNPYYLKIELDVDGGANYTDFGTSQLLSVPFAMYAATSGELQSISISNDTIYLSNGGYVKLPSEEQQVISLSNDTIYLSNGGYIKLPASLTGNTLVVNYTKNDNLCDGDYNGSINVTVTGGTPPYKYTWHDLPEDYDSLENNEDQDSLRNGTYSLYIEDNGGLSALKYIEITSPKQIEVYGQVDWTTDEVSTDGGVDIIITGGTAPYSFSWSNGATTEDISGVGVGNYTVTITDANACEQILEFNVNFEPYLTFEIDSVICESQYDYGVINTTIHGGSDNLMLVCIIDGNSNWGWPHSADWLSVGEYKIFAGIHDYQTGELVSHTDTTTINIIDNSPFVSDTIITSVQCDSGNEGAIDITVSGGTPPYTFYWQTPYGESLETEDITGGSGGFYTLEIADDDGCRSEEYYTIPFTFSLNIYDYALTNTSCQSASDGAIDITVEGDGEPFTYEWYDGDGIFIALTEDIENLEIGEYNVKVANMNGCEIIKTYYVSYEDYSSNLSITSANSDPTTCSSNDGSINITSVSGGSAPYSFEWYDEDDNLISTNQNLTGVNDGQYNLIIIPSGGCSYEPYEFELQPQTNYPIFYNDVVTNTTTCISSDGSITISYSDGGTSPYSFEWKDIDDNLVSTNEDLSGVSTGDYKFIVTDANNCIYEPEFIHISSDGETSFTFSSVVSNVTQVGAIDGIVDITITGGVTPYSYSWKNSSGTEISTDEDLTNVGIGTYTLEITDANNCVYEIYEFNIQLNN